jgi:hypothetical protein
VGLGGLVLSAGGAVVAGALRVAAVAGIAGLVWWLTCDSLTWFGGSGDWARWGLDGRLAPSPEGAVGRFVSYFTGAWFAVIAGLILVLPLADALRWGVVSYLRGWAHTRAAYEAPLSLSAEEQEEVAAATKK